MNEKLKALEESFHDNLKDIDTEAKLADMKARFLGKKGELSAILKTLGQATPEERKTLGQAANELKTRLTEKLDEARGQITSDYQNYLENQWIEELKVKYPVEVDRSLLTGIKL